MHCNLSRQTPRQFFCGLITTPCQVWSRWTYPLPYYSVSAADALLYAVTLTFDLWPWTFAVYRLWRNETLYQFWTQCSNPRRSYCDFNISPNDLEHCVTCCARLWDNFHQFSHLTTYPCLNYRRITDGLGTLPCGISLVTASQSEKLLYTVTPNFLLSKKIVNHSKLSDVENYAKFRTFWLM